VCDVHNPNARNDSNDDGFADGNSVVRGAKIRHKNDGRAGFWLLGRFPMGSKAPAAGE
jgi:hypothetical protein